MLGMVSFGLIADLIGINKAGMLSALLSVVGVTVMTFYSSDDLTTQFLMYSIFFGLFGLGVGGEYPLTAAGAAQHHHDTIAEAQAEDTAQRQIRILVCLPVFMSLKYNILPAIAFFLTLISLFSTYSLARQGTDRTQGRDDWDGLCDAGHRCGCGIGHFVGFDLFLATGIPRLRQVD